MYNDELLDHFRYPRHALPLKDQNASSKVVNSSCGDEIEVAFFVKEGVVEKISAQAVGCVISKASASLLAEKACGLSVKQILTFSKEEVIELVGIPLGPVRLRCALLPLEAFHKALLSLS